ncbi:MAG: DoxX family protein [Phycisphaeraceae bacterium]
MNWTATRQTMTSGINLNDPFADLALTAVRLYAGLRLALGPGWDKVQTPWGSPWVYAAVDQLGFPLPGLFAFGVGWMELLGGFLLALGLFTRPVAALLTIQFAVAAFGLLTNNPLFELTLTQSMFWMMLTFTALGGGTLSLDHLLRPDTPKPQIHPHTNPNPKTHPTPSPTPTLPKPATT